MRVGFVGMTHLGLVHARVALRMQQDTVVCYDEDPTLITHLRNGMLPVYEPGLDFEDQHERITFTNNLTDLDDCDLVFVTRDVGSHKEAELAPLRALILKLLEPVRRNSPVVLVSQVPFGFTRQVWEMANTRRPFYSMVDTLVFGDSMLRAVHPEQVIIGGAAAHAIPIEISYHFPVAPVSVTYEEAELIKLAINTYLAAQIGVTNTLARLCEAVGVDWRGIAMAVRNDKRIGASAYVNPGLGIVSSHLLRDVDSVYALCRRVGVKRDMLCGTLTCSVADSSWATALAAKLGLEKSTVAIWGIAYKAGTSSIENSPGVALCEFLKGALFVHDPVAVATSFNRVQDSASICWSGDKMSALRHNTDALFIMTPWQEYQHASLSSIRHAMRGNIIVDPYRVLNEQSARAYGFEYYGVGYRGPLNVKADQPSTLAAEKPAEHPQSD